MKALLTLGLPTCVGIVSYAHPDESGKSGSCHARKRFFLALIPILLLLLGRPIAQPAWAQVPEMMAYQGYLTTADGTPLDDPAAPLTFRLYAAAAGGTAIWTETQVGVAITEGVFSVLLGSVEDLSGVAFDRPLWLGVAVGDASAAELSPRVALEAAPYALSLRGLRIEPAAESPNLVGGYAGNTVAPGVAGATISGGGRSGKENTVSGGAYVTIGGGLENEASGDGATVGGGVRNRAIRPVATVGGGLGNAAADGATVGGGENNEAGGIDATVGGGLGNAASGEGATVGGGGHNRVEAPYGTIGGGGSDQEAEGNRVTDEGGTIGGGQNNQAGDDAGTTDDASFATVGGGTGNEASGPVATVGGGSANEASGLQATVSGGGNNEASGLFATVGGGQVNKANAPVATVGGGGFNRVTAAYGTIAGGGSDTLAEGNRVTDEGGTIGGGRNNQAGDAAGTTDDAPFATVGGGENNEASAPAATVGGGAENEASDVGATVGGGARNKALFASATVSGGSDNTASGEGATVAGGFNNTASGDWATVPGGFQNEAPADYSFATGRRARVDPAHEGAMLFADGADFDFPSTASSEFAVRARGGVRFVSSINTDGSPASGAVLPKGGSSWGTISDRKAKEHFAPVEGREVLRRLLSIPIQTWNYKTQADSIRHMGPMAQDFYAAFGVGEDDRHITTVDADGVALAAIQGLHQVLEEQQAEIVRLRQAQGQQQSQVEALRDEVTALRALVEDLVARTTEPAAAARQTPPPE